MFWALLFVYCVIGMFTGMICLMPILMSFDAPRDYKWGHYALAYLAMFVSFVLWPIAWVFIIGLQLYFNWKGN